jgi:hypothetical protein
MEQTTAGTSGEFIFLSRNSKLARLFQETAIRAAAATQAPPMVEPPPLPAGPMRATGRARVSPSACPKLQAVGNPNLELSRPLAAALMREQAGLRCRARGVLLDNEYIRDICAAGAHQHCPFLKD